MIELPKPGLTERTCLIRQYYTAYLHHDPPVDFLQSPAPAVSAALLTGTTKELARSEGVAARKDHDHHDDHSSSGRDTLRPKRTAPPLHPELKGEPKGCHPVGQAGTSEGGNGRRGGRAHDGAVRMSQEFRNKAPGLMAMLAVRSEGFYGRDVAHFFSAVQVREWQPKSSKRRSRHIDVVYLTWSPGQVFHENGQRARGGYELVTFLPLPLDEICWVRRSWVC